MCTKLTSIPNPNYNSKNPLTRRLKDTTSQRIWIKCGHCDECIKEKQIDMIQRIQMEAEGSYLFMVMLSYNERNIPKTKASDGHTFKHVDYEHIKNMMKRVRKRKYIDRDIRYIFTSEYGGKKHRPHYHGIIIVPKEEGDTPWVPINLEYTLRNCILKEWTINKGTNRKPIYDNLLDFKSILKRGKVYSNYDLHYIVPDRNGENIQAAFYVLKYLMKEDKYTRALHYAIKANYTRNIINDKGDIEPEWQYLWRILKPKWSKSEGFGVKGKKEWYTKDTGLGYTTRSWRIKPNQDTIKDLEQMIQLSYNGHEMPCYFNKVTGQDFPMAKYYKQKVMKTCDHLRFTPINEETGDAMRITDPKDRAQLKRQENLSEKRLKKIMEQGDCLDIFDIEE